MDMIKALVQSPELKGIQLKSFSAIDKQAIFDLAVYNPNAFAIPISGINGNITPNQLAIDRFSAINTGNLTHSRHINRYSSITIDSEAFIAAVKKCLYNEKLNITC